ncbi:hypothetical protein NQT62_11155 [Limnobacter humi]|uniref:RepB plasmid partition domain-containing protein n=1 Tax=Limnobacter humi TaxID=1778671 RepID=A0ABT1WHL7_9BURK|nr:hypothetical protein [Limnobacter humi]MCQ8896990.1 hypothetical protein [Limnobacter humi]
MQALAREKLLTALLSLGDVVNTYRKDSTRFVAAYFQWLENTDESVGPLRLPVSGLIQSQKSQLLAIEDGLMPPHVQTEGNSVRKRQRAATATLIDTMTLALQDKLQTIDRSFDDAQDKLAQCLAVLMGQQADFLVNIKPDNTGVAATWLAMNQIKELTPVLNYLTAKYPRADREYCLHEVLLNALS